MSLIIRTEVECDICHTTLPDHIYKAVPNAVPFHHSPWYWVGQLYVCIDCLRKVELLCKEELNK